MKVRIALNRRVTLALTVIALVVLAATASAQLLGVQTLRISVAPRITDGTSNTIATLVQDMGGSIYPAVVGIQPGLGGAVLRPPDRLSAGVQLPLR